LSDLYENLAKDNPNWANEEEVRKGWLKHIENSLGITFHAERGRNDASYNQVIIEFKDRGLFKGSTSSAAFKEAVFDRLDKYIRRRAKDEGLPEEDYIGIAIDGMHICFAFMKDGEITHRNLLPFNEASVDLVAQACADSKRRAVTSDNLVEDFGHKGEIGRTAMAALVAILERQLTAPGNNKIKLLFVEWRTLFGQVADLSKAQAAEIRKHIPFSPKLPLGDVVSASLFVIHSYNAFVMKLLAAEIVAQYRLTAFPDFCEHLLGYDDAGLLHALDVEVERGAFFEAARIKGFVEEAVFSWYVDGSIPEKERADLCAAIRPLLTQLALYRMDDLTAARSRDVLKTFYQALVPETLRKALGEFYTPDWLVDVACDRAEIADWSTARVLDPTCGSGSFLLEAIRRKRRLAEAAGRSPAETLAGLLNQVWGFDLNPLAVQAARVNFLIAVADLVASVGVEVELPVLLADAVYSPAQQPGKDEDYVEYGIGSAQANLNIRLPAALAFDRVRLDAAFVVMHAAVQQEDPYTTVEQQLVTMGLLQSEEAVEWRDALTSTYDQILELHRQAWNGIWFRVVRNFFWSAVAGEFDAVVGNPPWVRWSNLPEEYRERIKPTCERYTIFSETPYHGGNELDISGMITYTVADKWLKTGGALVFVITQTHFQSPSSQGFRSFRIDQDSNLIPEQVDDLKLLKPFSKVANKTAIVRMRKVGADTLTAYPVPYAVWEKNAGTSGSIPEAETKAAVLARVTQKAWEATPVDGGNSPWAILPPGRFQDMANIQGKSDWIAGRKGITTDLNGVYMVRVLAENAQTGLVQVETRPEAGKTDIGPARKFWIEPTLLYPLLKGAADFSACHVHVNEELFVLVPNTGINKADYVEADRVLNQLPQTKRYFQHFQALLGRRSTYKQRQSSAPSHVVYNAGTYTFAPYKVVWAELSNTFEAAVVTDAEVPLVGRRPFVPDHKVYFADFDDEDEAYFVAGTLNSSLIQEYVESHTIQIQVSNIFKHLSIPKYDANDADHGRLVELAKDAHAAATAADRQILLAEIDEVADRILIGGAED
jgi:SAM-dependent methyltransferase